MTALRPLAAAADDDADVKGGGHVRTCPSTGRCSDGSRRLGEVANLDYHLHRHTPANN